MYQQLKLTPVGGAGSATVTANFVKPTQGFIHAVSVVYATAPGTTTVTITEDSAGDKSMAQAIIATGASNTNTIYRPRVLCVTPANVAITNWADYIYLSGQYIKVAVAASDPTALITVIVQTLDMSEYI